MEDEGSSVASESAQAFAFKRLVRAREPVLSGTIVPYSPAKKPRISKPDAISMLVFSDRVGMENCSFFTLTNYASLIEIAASNRYIDNNEIDTLNNWRKSPKTWS